MVDLWASEVQGLYVCVDFGPRVWYTYRLGGSEVISTVGWMKSYTTLSRVSVV